MYKIKNIKHMKLLNYNYKMSLVIKIRPLVLVGCSGSGRNALMYHLIHNLPYKF